MALVPSGLWGTIFNTFASAFCPPRIINRMDASSIVYSFDMKLKVKINSSGGRLLFKFKWETRWGTRSTGVKLSRIGARSWGGDAAAYNPAKHKSDPCVKISSYLLFLYIPHYIFLGAPWYDSRVSIHIYPNPIGSAFYSFPKCAERRMTRWSFEWSVMTINNRRENYIPAWILVILSAVRFWETK